MLDRNNNVVDVGDRVAFKDSNQYVGGGHYQYDGEGVVKGSLAGGISIEVTKWNYHYSCSQKFGNSAPPKEIVLYQMRDGNRYLETFPVTKLLTCAEARLQS